MANANTNNPQPVTTPAPTPTPTPTIDPALFGSILGAPEVRRTALATVDAQISEHEQQIEKLKAMREALTANGDVEVAMPKRRGAPARRPGRPPATTQARGRPAGSSPQHKVAIQDVLRGTKGLTANQIFEKLEKKNHAGGRNTWASYLSKMKRDGDLVGVREGDERNLLYKLSA